MIKTVVVVDDDLDTLEFLEVLLSSRGMVVVPCDHSCDPVEVIQQTRPDVVLLDLQNRHDHLSGLAILVQLRADDLTAKVSVILMTADHDALNRHAARLRDLGAALLKKPFEPELLVQLIEQAAA